MRILLAAALLLTAFAATVPTVTAIGDPTPHCYTGIAQDWCTVQAGGCQATVTTWTAWGDRSASADCKGCHVEAHTDDPADPEAC